MNWKKIDNKLYSIEECKQCEGTEKVSYIGERKDTCLACKDGKIETEIKPEKPERVYVDGCEQIDISVEQDISYDRQLRLYKLIMDALGEIEVEPSPGAIEDYEETLSQYKGVGGVITKNK